MGRESTSCIASWYRVLTNDTRAFVCVISSEPILHLLPENHASTNFMYSLAKRWWHTTHTFHIVDREMTVTPYNFHQMTSLRYDGSFINLEGELGTALRIELLGWGYMMDTICYFDIETNYRPLPQKNA